jgi:hypothetical protein
MNASIAVFCEPECPVDAIKPDTEPGLEKWLGINAEYARVWPNITVKREPAQTQRSGRTSLTSQLVIAEPWHR